MESMFVGVARLVIQIPGARSLKDRRQVIKSFKERARARLPLSIAEVGDVERLQVATLGVSVVARDAAYCESVLSQLRDLANGLPDGVLADMKSEVSSFGDGGSGIGGGIESLSATRDAPAGDFSDLAEKWGKP